MASLGVGSSANSPAGLDPLYARAGIWSGPEANSLPRCGRTGNSSTSLRLLIHQPWPLRERRFGDQICWAKPTKETERLIPDASDTFVGNNRGFLYFYGIIAREARGGDCLREWDWTGALALTSWLYLCACLSPSFDLVWCALRNTDVWLFTWFTNPSLPKGKS
jgi:hypothetical protein